VPQQARTEAMITGFDHLVLTVRNLDATVRFYVDGLGMRLEAFGAGRRALHFGSHKINLHLAGQEFEPKAQAPTPGSADLCFLSATPVEQVAAHLKALGHRLIEGPVERIGATGRLRSIYLRDPDGNLIEIANRG
jgi:catechol 2,3-dioxygenase-like lactoylglutathione lyase family enzyme